MADLKTNYVSELTQLREKYEQEFKDSKTKIVKEKQA